MPRFQIRARFVTSDYDIVAFRQRPVVAAHQAEAIHIVADEVHEIVAGGLQPDALEARPLDDGPGPDNVTTR